MSTKPTIVKDRADVITSDNTGGNEVDDAHGFGCWYWEGAVGIRAREQSERDGSEAI